ncbi:MAG: TIGR02301 family protein [Rhodomicrobium sp.]|nr:MAG: TIGR02301 family protein [Rhodomicrobium sp.]
MRKPLKNSVVAIFLATLLLSTSLKEAHSAAENRPYDASLLRLSEILGAVHYLRALCGINDQQAWRKKMEQLISAEGQTVKRKLKLTKSFNKGYRSFQRTYRHCTPSAKVAIDHFLDEGIDIAEKLVANR